jgi:selenoprotein W-related protein
VKTEVSIEYCVVWNYTPKAVSLATKILELGDRIKSLTLIPSGGGAFEIQANGKLLHSKLQSGDWPDFDAMVKAIKKSWSRPSSLQYPNTSLLQSIFCPESDGRLVVLEYGRVLDVATLQRSTLNAQHSTLNSDSWMLDVGYWTLATAEPVHGGGGLDVSFFSESDGCLVALAVFKTVVGS